MILKKTISTLMAVSMLAATTVAFADTVAINEEPAVIEETLVYDKAELYGTAKIEEGSLYIVTETGDVMLNADENTLFVDAQGFKTTVEAIENGASLKVIASQAMTMSLPPQSYAHVVILADENGGFPFYVEVKKVLTDENGNFAFPSKDGQYDIIVAPDMSEILPFATRNIVTAADIKENSRILVYSDVMTMSIPAVVPSQKVVILPEEMAASEEAIIEKVVVNGEELVVDGISAVINKDSVIMLPVRAICEKADLEVSWDDTLKAVTVGTVPMGVTFNIGENAYTKAKMMPQTLSSEPIAENERTYVPVDFFTDILGATVSTENGTISVSFN